MLWLIIIGVIFYQGAKRRALIPYAWAFIGIGSLIGGLLLGLGILWIASLISNAVVNYYFLIVVFGLIAVGFAYWYMDRFAKKNKSVKDFKNDALLDDDFVEE